MNDNDKSTQTRRSACCALLSAIALLLLGCAAPVEPEADGRIGQVELALVDLVGNPGSFEFELRDDSRFWFPGTYSILLQTPATPYMDFTANIAASGAISGVVSHFFNSALFTGTCGPFFTYLVLDGSTTGTADPGAQAIDLLQHGDEGEGLHAKLTFTGAPGQCETDVFPIDASGLINDPDGCGGNDLGETEFCIDAEDIEIPEAHSLEGQPMSCTNPACVNNLLALPTTGGTGGALFLHGATTAEIEAP